MLTHLAGSSTILPLSSIDCFMDSSIKFPLQLVEVTSDSIGHTLFALGIISVAVISALCDLYVAVIGEVDMTLA